ncbi:transcription factor MYB3R-1-like [Silene latifolia]|uniref:transcription factor MYB3R-1-like n=1 Tax=Silene latifolia TaxID=37657 RepID=UPI003D782696
MEGDRKIAASLPPAPPSAPPPTLSGSSNAFTQPRPIHGRTSGPTRRSTRGQWTPEEDEILRAAVQRFKGKNWKKIAESFKDRTDVQCLHRWQKVLNPDLIKGPWSKEEDEIIVQMVKKYGPKKWSTIAQHLPGRIGKQCRERWHNHLNPGINKEAWTQEEELVLIHAHELHGNKWAELTKYLPGRTDNAIKNHWNSSVKKKLESYKASGLLAQLQGLTLIGHQNQPVPAEGEEISECSQFGCSQTASEMSNAGCHTREDFLVSEGSDQGMMQNTSPTASCSEQHYTPLDDMTFTIPDIPCEFTCSSNYDEANFSKDMESGQRDGIFGSISLPMNSSLNMAPDSCLPGNFFLGQMPNAEEGCSQIILTQEEDDANVERCSPMIDLERFQEYMNFQSIYDFSETGGTAALLPYNHSSSGLEASNSDKISSPLDVPGENGRLTIGDMEHNLINDGLSTSQGQESTEQTHLPESSRLVPVNTFVSKISDDQQTTPPRLERPMLPNCEQEVGTLCYEPPRFPSLDIPFFSCDLAQSGNDAQQDFSPLGIRQLMSSASSVTPFKLWDSPSSDDSPEALLKSAAKTFARTPSILKKRHRDLLSPLSPFSERRYDKKTGSDVNQGFLCTSRLTREFSCLDVILDETVNPKDHAKASTEDKENICPGNEGFRGEANYNQEFEVRISEEDTCMNDGHSKEKERTPDGNSKKKFYEDCASETPRGALVERHLNGVELSSPVGIRPLTGLQTSDRSTEVANFKNTSEQAAIAKSPCLKTGSLISPLSFDHMKKYNGSAVSSSGQPVSAVTTVMVDSLVNEVGAENLNFFGGTPFRRSMESPSAWKSPWYFSSLVSCPRFEPDITIEDIGIFMSPGERSFDAIGLMKQINEQGADSYADAREVLGGETPDSILKQRCSKKLNIEGESSNVLDCQLDGRLHMTPNISTERRVLDFSECGTPTKSMGKMKHVGDAMQA